MEWLHLYNTPEALVYKRTGGRPPLPGDRGRPWRDNPCRPTFSLSPARSRCRSGAALDAAPSGRLGGRAVRPDLLPRDDPRRPASSGIVVEEGQKAARPGQSGAPACRADPGYPGRCPARPPSPGLPGRSPHSPGPRPRLRLVGARPAPVDRLALAASVGQALVLRPLSLQRRPSAALALCPRQRRAHRRCPAPAPGRMAQLIVVGASYHRAGIVREAATALQIDLVPLPGYIHAGRGAGLREDVTDHYSHPTADDLSRRVAAFETRLNQDVYAVADRLKDR